MSETKIYLCKQLTLGRIQCGETDPSKFATGRYSQCKNCKNKYVREHLKNQREAKKLEELNKKVQNFSSERTISSTASDSLNLQELVKNIIKLCPLIESNTIYNSFKELELEISELNESFFDKIESIHQRFDVMNRQINSLFEKIQDLESKK